MTGEMDETNGTANNKIINNTSSIATVVSHYDIAALHLLHVVEKKYQLNFKNEIMLTLPLHHHSTFHFLSETRISLRNLGRKNSLFLDMMHFPKVGKVFQNSF